MKKILKSNQTNFDYNSWNLYNHLYYLFIETIIIQKMKDFGKKIILIYIYIYIYKLSYANWSKLPWSCEK